MELILCVVLLSLFGSSMIALIACVMCWRKKSRNARLSQAQRDALDRVVYVQRPTPGSGAVAYPDPGTHADSSDVTGLEGAMAASPPSFEEAVGISLAGFEKLPEKEKEFSEKM